MVSLSRPTGNLEEAQRRRRKEQEEGATVHTTAFHLRQIDREIGREPVGPPVEPVGVTPRITPRVTPRVTPRARPEVPAEAPAAEPIRFASETQFRLLRDILEQGLGTRTITQSIFLNPLQASELGIAIEEGEFLRIEAGPAGEPLVRLITPEGITEAIPFEDVELPELDLIERIYPDVEDLTIAGILDVIEADPNAFIDDLIARGQNEDTESLLQLLGLDDQAIRNLFRFGDIPEEGQPHIFEVEGVRKQGVLTPNGILSKDDLQIGVVNFQTGEFKSIEDIRHEMLPSEEEMRETLRIGQVPVEEWDKIINQYKEPMSDEQWFQEWRKINPSFTKTAGYSLIGRSVAAGLGDVLQAGGGVAGWAGQQTWRDNLLDVGEVLQSTAPPMVPYTTLGETIGNPQFWMTTAVRTSTLSVVAMVPVLLGAAAGAPVAGVVGLGSTGTAILTLLFGSTAGALPEAALEAGGAWNEAKRLGMSDEEASKAAGSVYWKNAGLLFGANALGFGLPFVKVPGRIALSGLLSKGFVKPIIVGGKLVGTSLTEGGQEFYQDIITRTALGQEVKWDDEAKLAVLLGTILGGVTGGGLIVFDTIMSRTKAQFTPEQQNVFDEQKQLQLDDGAVDAAAELRAMDFMVENFEDVKTNLEGNVEQVNREEAAKLIVSEDRAEDLALEHVIEQGEFGVAEPTFDLTEELIGDAESIVTQAEAVQPDNPQVQEMRRLVNEAKTATGEARREALIKIEGIEDEVKGIAGIEPVPTEVPEVTGQIAPFGDDVGDILAVLNDKKPVSIVNPANLNIIDPVFAREKGMQVRIINFGGEKTAIVFRKGNEGSADKIEELSKRIVDTPEFHRELGETLGFSEADIQVFLQRKLELEPQPTPPAGVTLPVSEVSKLETRIPLDLIRKDEAETIARLTEDIRKEGIKEPIVIRIRDDGTRIVWDGIHRLIVAQDLGLENIPVRFIDDEGVGARPTPLPELPSRIVEQAAEKDITIEELTTSSMSETIPPETIVETTPDTVDDMPIVHDVNVIDRFRPTRFVFDKMGLFDIWESTFKAETLRAEEQVAFNKELKKHAKNVKDPARRELVWEHVNNSKSDVFNQLTFEEKQAANWWKRTADDWADRLNIPQERRIQNYIPHIFDDAAKQVGDVPLDASLSMVFSKKITDKVKMPFLEERLGKELGLIKDPFLAAQAYQNVALRKFYYEPILQKLKLVAEHSTTPEFAKNYLKDYSRRMTGEPATIDREINKTLVDIANNLRGLPGGETLANFLDRGNASAMSAYNLTSALYVMWLGFKPTTAIRNLSQHGLIIAEVDSIQDFGNGIRLRVTAEGRNALAESLVVRSRKGAFIESIDSSVTAKGTDAFRETALFLFRKADEQNVKDAFLSGYAEAKRLFPEAGRDIWIKRGDEVAADTQYLYTKMNSLAIAQSGPGKVGAMLTTWAINWLELMNKFVQGKQSRVYTDANLDVKEKNWLTSRTSLLTYMAIVGLAYGLTQQDWNRIRAFEYTGATSINTFANLVGGEFPGLELPGAVADLIAGTLLGDERKTKTSWNTLRRSFSILNQVERVASGERDWLSLFFYLEGKNHQVRKLKEDWQKNWKPYDDLADPLIREKEFPGLNRNTAQKRWREQNPLVEAQMFITNRLGTLSSKEARQEVLRLIEKHNIDTDVIGGYEKIFGVDTTTELTKFEKRIGQLGELEAGKEAKYFTVGSFLTEANEAVRINGRDKVERDGHPFTIFLLGEQDSWQPYEDYDNADARRLYRQLNPDVEASLYLAGKIQAFENPESAKVLLRIMDKFNISPQAVLAFNQDPDKYDELFTPKFELEVKNFDLSNEFDELETDEERDKFREDNPQWVADMRRIEAIDKNVPESLQDAYVDYYTLPVAGFEQERFLRDNQDYYNNVWLGVLGNQEIDFEKIPTVKFEETLTEYEKLDLGKERYDFRGENLDFDAEGVKLGKWKPFEERKVKPKAEVEPRPKTKEPIERPKRPTLTRRGQLEELERKRQELQR